jgi:hypothetical protein
MYCTRISKNYCGLYSTALRYGIETAMMAFELKTYFTLNTTDNKNGKKNRNRNVHFVQVYSVKSLYGL